MLNGVLSRSAGPGKNRRVSFVGLLSCGGYVARLSDVNAYLDPVDGEFVSRYGLAVSSSVFSALVICVS
jgi:hypothetical protein